LRITAAPGHGDRLVAELVAQAPVFVASKLKGEKPEQGRACGAVGTVVAAERRLQHGDPLAIDARRGAEESAVVGERCAREAVGIVQIPRQPSSVQQRLPVGSIAGLALRFTLGDDEVAALEWPLAGIRRADELDRLAEVRSGLLVRQLRDRVLPGTRAVLDRRIQVTDEARLREVIRDLREIGLDVRVMCLFKRSASAPM
jgi:hypothetical protein